MNPYLPNWEYVPDGEPRVFGDRLYVFGSHDRFRGWKYCQNDYVAWSAPVDDLSDWTLHGEMFRRDQDPSNADAKRSLWAPDVVRGSDGRYYAYYGLEFAPAIGVAVADIPEGPYEYYGRVAYPTAVELGSQAGDIFPFDPGVLVDDDGRVYLYLGFGPTGGLGAFIRAKKREFDGAYVVELAADDMRTVIAGPTLIAPKEGKAHGTSFEGHEFYEAASMRKIEGIYHLVYSSIEGHELCYATSDRPDRGFEYQGVLVSNGDIGVAGRSKEDALNYYANNHGSLMEVAGTWYIFYHRHTNYRQFSRQGCAEPIQRDADGRFHQAQLTSTGLRGAPFEGSGTFPTASLCVLRGPRGAKPVPPAPWTPRRTNPYLTQSGKDREHSPDQHVTNIRDGALVGFRHFDLRGTRSISVDASGGDGRFEVSTRLDGPPVVTIPLASGTSGVPLPSGLGESEALYFRYRGGGKVAFRSFTLGG